MIDMTEGAIGRKIFKFTIPLFMGNIFQQLYNMVDSIIVGQFIGKKAIASVGVSFPVMFLIIALMMGATMGLGIFVSQFFGAKNFKALQRTISTGFIFVGIFSFVIMAFGLLFVDYILKFLATPLDIFDKASAYMKIIFMGMPLLFGYNSLAAILNGLGDSKTPLLFLIIATIINIFLDLLFVVGFRWDVEGAAIATVIAQGFSFVFGLIFLFKKNDIFKFEKGNFVFDFDIFVRSIKIGIPSGIQQLIVAFGMMALMNIVNSFGTDVLASYTAATRIESFAVMPIMNFSMAISTFVAQNLGAGRIDRINRGVRSTLIMVLSISAVTTLIILVFAPFLISIFNRDSEVVRIGTEYLRVVGNFYFVFAIMFIYNGVLRGAGDTVIPMFSSLISQFLLRVPTAYFLSKIWGTKGIWFGIPIAWCFGMLFSFVYYRIGKWKEKRLVKRDFEKESLIESEEL